MLQTKAATTPSPSFDHHLVLFPTRSDAGTTKPAGPLRTQPVVPASESSRGRLRRRVVRNVVVLEVAGPLSEVIDDLGRAIEQALTEGTRGVVCDLSAVPEGAEPAAVEVLATAGRHVRDWSGNPVAVACPDPAVRAALAADHLGGHLIVTASMFSAVSMVLLAPKVMTKRLRLAPHPTATTAAREFVTQTLKDWGLDPIIFAANLVVSELVTNSVVHAVTGIDLSIAWNRRALRLTVRDDSPALEPQRYSSWDLPGSRPRAVADLARAFGVLPTAEDGRVTWAVLNATSPSAGRTPFWSPRSGTSR